MNNRPLLLMIGGILVVLAMVAVGGIFIGGIGLILVLTLAVSLYLNEKGRQLGEIPDLDAVLSSDAKRIIIRNHGNGPAVAVHVAIVPLNKEFDAESIDPDGKYVWEAEEMIQEAKAAIIWHDTDGRTYSNESRLSALGKGEDDLLKPMFPLFDSKPKK
ncbi:hypothetical protein AZH53_06515 [Methanomicrobiaceae archaeon CYW5]|uniref:hypothetical protein n=1 Tax=Methanovulcanius yangii TaxID=1789227 RepID=UPI0029CA5D2C|nr:hypothetical protein [Methanovulcanius yangii]MBT8508056.1 hypothetical protein [Methanovulcanius yangii]